MKFMSHTVENKLAQYKQILLNHVSKPEDIQYPKQLLGRRRHGRLY